MSWRRDPKAELKSLPLERKVLAERYTIDADEASRREQFAAEDAERRAAAEEAARLATEEQARRAHEAEVMRAAAESARRAAEAEAERRAAGHDAEREAASAAMQREFDEQAQAAATRRLVLASQASTDSPVAEPAAEAPVEEASDQTADLPIYRWFNS